MRESKDCRNSFEFDAIWYEAIKHLPRVIQGEVLTSIIEYGLYGETTGEQKQITKTVLTMVKAQIDSRIVKSRRKGGAPKGSHNNPKGRRKELTKTNQELTSELTGTNSELTAVNHKASEQSDIKCITNSQELTSKLTETNFKTNQELTGTNSELTTTQKEQVNSNPVIRPDFSIESPDNQHIKSENGSILRVTPETSENEAIVSHGGLNLFFPDSAKEEKRKEQESSPHTPFKEKEKKKEEIFKEEKIIKKEDSDLEKIIEYFNNAVKDRAIPAVIEITPPRRNAITFIRQKYGMNEIFHVIDMSVESDFLSGRSNRYGNFVASFDWIFNPDHFLKIMEGTYNNRSTPPINQQQTHSYGKDPTSRQSAEIARYKEFEAYISEAIMPPRNQLQS